MSEQIWSEWIEHKRGTACPIPWAQGGDCAIRMYDGQERMYAGFAAASMHGWLAGTNGAPHFDIAAYRYRLDRAPAGFVPPGQLWYPPQVPGFGPWVECDGAPPPPADGKVMVARLQSWEREAKSYQHAPDTFSSGNEWGAVSAYCVALEDQPTADEVEATQRPWSPEQDAADWEADNVEANRPMFSADEAGVKAGKWDRHNARAALLPPTPAPPFMVAPVRSGAGLLTEWPVGDHRLGRFV